MHSNLHFYLHITIFTPYKRLYETPHAPPLDKGGRRVGWLFVIRSSADHSTKWDSRKLFIRLCFFLVECIRHAWRI